MLTSVVGRTMNRIERCFLGEVAYYRRRGAKIGKVRVFSRPRLAEPHLCEIGDNVWITGGVTLLNHDGAIAMLNCAGMTDAVNVVGKIVVFDNVFIGINSTIMPGVSIGPCAVVAAGSVVVRDVPPNTVCGGTPAKVICTIDEYIRRYDDPTRTIWAEDEESIFSTVVDALMHGRKFGKWALRLRTGVTKLTRNSVK